MGNFNNSLAALGSTLKDLRRPGATKTSAQNAANWNRPGGGYDQWKANDTSRGPQDPAPMQSTEKQVTPRPLGSFKKGGKVKKTGLYKLHKGEVVKKAKRKMVRLSKLTGY